MEDSKTAPSYRVPALERALDVLGYLAGQPEGRTLGEITKDLSIPKASLFRILKTLAERGFVCMLDENTYALGRALSRMDRSASSMRELSAIARPLLTDLAFETGQVTQLSMLVDYGVMYIDAALPPSEVSIIAPLRKVLPVNISAGGKSLLAYRSDSEREAFLQRATLADNTAKSITDLPAFRRELEKIRRDGYALDDEEYAIGVGCLAMPVFDEKGVAVAAVGTTGRYIMYDAPEKIAAICRQIAAVRDRFGQRLVSLRAER